MLRILFVDDEPLLLRSLRRVLLPLAGRWEVAYAGSGAEGLQLLAGQPFDVVVSDMHMPGMDGATFLGKVRDLYPHTVRLVLSGLSDEGAIMRVMRVAHQFIGKPFDSANLPSVIERAASFQKQVTDEGQRAMIAGLDQIPSPSRSYWEITAALSDPSAGLDRIARLVESDPGVSVKLLQLVNSAYFGLSQQVTSVARGLTLLGAETLRSLVFAAHVTRALEQVTWATPEIHAAFERVQARARVAAGLARRIRGAGPHAQAAFMGGLFHDLGKLVAAAGRPAQFEELLRGPQGPVVLERERALFGFSHPEAGAYLLGLWGIPDPIVEAVARHHAPAEVEPDRLGTVGAVHVAAALTDELAGGTAETALDLPWLGRLGLEGQLPEWRSWASKEGES